LSTRREQALDWLDERTGVREIVRSQLTEYEVPASTSRWHSLGFALLVFFGLQIVTGILLLVYYVPHADQAFESVQRLMNEIPYGWLIRLLHVHGANAMVIILLVHLLSVILMGAYRRPRELTWVVGCAILLTTLGQSLTGYVLPWSQLSYWATTVAMNITGSAPLAGPVLQKLLQGGEVVGPRTLGLLYAIHVGLLPLVMMGLIGIHLYLVRHLGITQLPVAKGSEKKPRSFFPDVMLDDLTVILFILAAFLAVMFAAPNLYFTEESFRKADPFLTPEHVKPEWYFLAAYAVMRLIPSKTIGILLQGVAIGGLFALPFLDRSDPRPGWQRPRVLAGVGVTILVLVALTIYGAVV
jgi:ubiquinol-cytochrome c reductase cytochrome b subunit